MCSTVKHVLVSPYFLLICKKKLGPGDRVLTHLVFWLYVVAATHSLSALVPYAINIAIIGINPPKNPHQNVWKILCLVPRWHVCHFYTDLKFYKETSRWKSTVRSVIDSYMYQTMVLRTFPWHNISFKTICAKEWIFLRIVYEPELESPYAEFWNCCFKIPPWKNWSAPSFPP